MKVIMLSDYSQNNMDVFNFTVINHIQYCQKYNIDFLSVMKPYSPRVDFGLIENLFERYDVVITIGTDILITNFDKNVLDYKGNCTLTIQEECPNGSVNGDFMIFDKNYDYQRYFDFFKRNQMFYKSFQDLINYNKKLESILKLPVRTIQSIFPYGINAHNMKIKESLWKPGDFSVHCHRPGKAPDKNHKIEDLIYFIQTHGNK